MNMVNSKMKGNIAESRILYEFVQRGIPVSIPYGDNERYDMIAEFNGKLNKIQIKFCNQQIVDGSISCPCSNIVNPLTKSKHRELYVNDVDYMAFYIYVWDVAVIIPTSYIGNRIQIKIRKERAKNNQTTASTFVDDFTFDKIVGADVRNVIEEQQNVYEKAYNRCVDCGCAISDRAVRCLRCRNLKQYEETANPNMIDRDTLKSMIRNMPFKHIASICGVSDNCIRNWCKRYNLPYRTSDIKKYTDGEWSDV